MEERKARASAERHTVTRQLEVLLPSVDVVNAAAAVVVVVVVAVVDVVGTVIELYIIRGNTGCPLLI